MANVYMPYNVAGQQQALLEGLLGSKQAQKQSQFDIGQQKGEMSEEFQKEAIAAQKKQEEILERQRGGKLWEKLLPIASMFGGPIASGVLGGLQGMYGMGKESKFAKARIEEARWAGIDDKWGGTFLGGQARDITGKTETMLDRMEREADVSGMDLLTKGVTSGVKGYAMGKMGEGIKEAFGPLKEMGGGDLLKLVDSGQIDIIDIMGGGKAPGGFFEKLMKGLSQDPSTLLKGEGLGGNMLKNLLLMLQQMGGR